MSRKKKRKEGTPMPATSAGLLRFYEEKTASAIKIRPEIVITLTVALIIVVLIANIFLSPI
jgi:preprotein translocase subunit Sec61beta